VRDNTYSEVLDKASINNVPSDAKEKAENDALLTLLSRVSNDARLLRTVAADSVAQFENFDAGVARAIESLRSSVARSVSIVVTSVANTVATWRSSNEANETLEKSLVAQKEAISGVNLDEEAANLVKYQQLYNASSKLLQAGRQMFDTLLSMLTVN
jgi:flagellar hook-associated protein FlgK